MPGEPGVTVVTTLVYFFILHARPWVLVGRPAFPAPSEVEGQGFVITRAFDVASTRNCALNTSARPAYRPPTLPARRREKTGFR
jgi:hypothetical protein